MTDGRLEYSAFLADKTQIAPAEWVVVIQVCEEGMAA